MEFLNSQMDPAEVLAVEIPRFEADGLETLVPRLIGQTEEARTRKSAGSHGAGTGRQWDSDSFLGELGRRFGEPATRTARRIMAWADEAGLDPSFGKDGDKNIQWQVFVRKTKLISAPEHFEEVIGAVKLFLEPLVSSIVERRAVKNNWIAPGPWR